MKTAKDFSKHAAQCEQLAAQINPPDSDNYRDARTLAVYHLRAAAKQSREIAEHMASKGNDNA